MEQMTASQISEWIAYSYFEPFGPVVENQRMGMICATICNAITSAVCDPKKVKKWFHPEDFFPDPLVEESKEQKPKKQTVEEMKEVLKLIAGVK